MGLTRENEKSLLATLERLAKKEGQKEQMHLRQRSKGLMRQGRSAEAAEVYNEARTLLEPGEKITTVPDHIYVVIAWQGNIVEEIVGWTSTPKAADKYCIENKYSYVAIGRLDNQEREAHDER